LVSPQLLLKVVVNNHGGVVAPAGVIAWRPVYSIILPQLRKLRGSKLIINPPTGIGIEGLAAI
jgi:hypothetical protein